MPFTEEEKRQRKNQRQREYAKRSGYAANNRYAASHPDKSVAIAVRLQRPKDDDIIEYMSTIKNKADFFRRIVREEIEKHS